MKKDKAEESLSENKRILPKEVSEVEIRDCDQNTVKEKKHDNCFSKQSNIFSGNVILMNELPINGKVDIKLNDITDARDCKNMG